MIFGILIFVLNLYDSFGNMTILILDSTYPGTGDIFPFSNVLFDFLFQSAIVFTVEVFHFLGLCNS